MEVTVLSGIDYALIILYLVFTVGLGMYIGRKIKTGKDYFLAGRNLPWWAVGMSMVVSDIGAADIVGIAGSAYLYGIVMANFDWIGCVPIMILCSFIVISYLWRSQVYTIPEFLGKRFNLGVRTVSALIWGVFLACSLGVLLYATAVMMKTMLGWPIIYSIIISAVMIGLYTMVGGLAAVVFTDVLQCIIMFIGCTITLFVGLNRIGGISGLTEAVSNMGEQYGNHFSLILPADTETPYPWSGIFFGLTLVLAPAYWFGNQTIVQRCLGCRSEFEAKAAFVWGALLKTIIPFIMVIPGLIALTYYGTGITDADSALPRLIGDILPPGLLGIFFAAFIAALMSSVDSYLNSAATLWTKDIYQRLLRPNKNDRHYLIVGRILTFVFIVWGCFFAIWIQGKAASLYSIIQNTASLFQGPTLMLILSGILWWRTTGIGAFVGMMAGMACSTTLFLTNVYSTNGLFQIEDPFLYITLWSFVVSAVVTVIVSLLTPPEPDEKLVGLVYRYKGGGKNAKSV